MRIRTPAACSGALLLGVALVMGGPSFASGPGLGGDEPGDGTELALRLRDDDSADEAFGTDDEEDATCSIDTGTGTGVDTTGTAETAIGAAASPELDTTGTAETTLGPTGVDTTGTAETTLGAAARAC